MWVVSWLCPDVSFLTAFVMLYVLYVCVGMLPQAETGRAVTTPTGASRLHLHGVVACQPPGQPAPPRETSVSLLQVPAGGADTARGPGHPLVPLPGWRAWGWGQRLPVLGKERIIIPGQAASVTNLREVIVERVERQKFGTSIQPSTRVIE